MKVVVLNAGLKKLGSIFEDTRQENGTHRDPKIIWTEDGCTVNVKRAVGDSVGVF